MSSPTSRTMQRLRAAGYLAAITERWNPHASIRQDLFGFIDLVAIRSDKPGVLAIQCCALCDVSKRRHKIASIAASSEWLAAGNRIEIWGWEKRAGKYMCKRVRIEKDES